MTQRVNLNVLYRDKDAAKALGARWDQAARTWWATLEQCNIEPGLLRWSGGSAKVATVAKPAAKTTSHKGSRPVTTERRLFSLAECNCRDVAPWEHCDHTDQEPELDDQQRAHMAHIRMSR